jgi:hypothetical protein
MIPEAGTLTEFKATVLETCTVWPQYREVYAVDTTLLWGALAPRSIEYWILVKMEWMRRQMATSHGHHTLPLKPELVFEFKNIFQDDDVVAWRPQKAAEILLDAPHWKRGLARGSIKFTGFIDDPGNRNERRV